MANGQSARSAVVSRSGKAWAAGRLSSKEYFTLVRLAARETARSDVAARIDGSKPSR